MPNQFSGLRVPLVCANCGAITLRKPSQTHWKTAFCGRRCYGDFKIKAQAATLFDRIDTSGGLDACHPWTGHRFSNGYGYVGLNDRSALVHRVVMERHLGRPLQEIELVLHRCDNRICANIDHLFIGTQADNMHDMIAKGRQGTYDRRGDRNPKARLTPADVLRIREMVATGTKQADLARQYNVTPEHISCIARRKTWAHI